MQGAAVVAFQMSLAHAAMPGPGDDQAPGDGGQIAPGFADVLLRQGRTRQAHKGVMGQVGGIVTVAQVFAQQAEGIHLLHVRYRGWWPQACASFAQADSSCGAWSAPPMFVS